MKRIADTDLEVSALCFGSNIFGWTADESASFSVLDAYHGAGGNFIDTADVYSAWAPGNVGGESETIIGSWMKARGNRNDLVIATKVGGGRGDGPRLSEEAIRVGIEASLNRLQIDCIDLYYAHRDDQITPLEESLGTFDALVKEGKVRYIAASNFTAPRLKEALEISAKKGIARYVALQPHYNLVHRDEFEGELQDLCNAQGIASLPYAGLASGFLTGKYRDTTKVDTPRADGASKYLDERGRRVLAVLDELSAVHGVSLAAVALSWLAAQPAVVSPIASARNAEQLADLDAFATLELDEKELDALDVASR